MLAENAPFGLILTQNNKPVYINGTLKWFGPETISNCEERGFVNLFILMIKRWLKCSLQKLKKTIPSPVAEKLRFVNKDGKIRFVRLDLINNTISIKIIFKSRVTDITDDVIKEKQQNNCSRCFIYQSKNSILSEIESMLTKILAHNKIF